MLPAAEDNAMKRIGTAILTLIVGLVSTNTWACGDNLYRVAKGGSQRVYTAPVTGSVLVYSHSDSGRQLAAALAESGHSVEVVESQIDLTLKLQNGDYDVVIAAYGDHSAIESSATHTAYLPVALNKIEKKIAEQSYAEVMLAERDEVKHYLKAIHKTLKAKAA